MPTPTGNDKASFTNLTTGEVLSVQFNPTEFTLTDTAQWRDQGNRARPSLQYERGAPASLSMELWFDTTRGGDNVNTAYINAFRALLEQSVTDTTAQRTTDRPPYLQFSWGGFELVCVVERIQVLYSMFKPDGTPVRAKVQLQLKEHATDAGAVTGTGATTPASLAGTTTATVGPGQTLSSVAQANGASTADVARANNISDPANVAPGTEVVIPGDASMADAMEASSKSTVPTSFSEAGAVDPFSDPVGGGFGGVMQTAEEMGGALHDAQDAADEGIGQAQDAATTASKTAAKADDARDAANETVDRADVAQRQVESSVERTKRDLDE